MNLQEQLDFGPGFSSSESLSQDEYIIIENAITQQWTHRIDSVNPSLSAYIFDEKIDIKSYHLISPLLDHDKIWIKKWRILPSSFASWFYTSNFVDYLRTNFGDFIISDEEGLGWPNIYWRLVRPLQKGDIGPLHRDEWFWILNPNYLKPEYPFKRIKVWISIHGEPGLNGLLVESGSHKRTDIKWEGELRHGSIKPVLLTDQSHLNPELVICQPGQSIIFNDKLIHGGALNTGKYCRVSLEFTILVRKNLSLLSFKCVKTLM